MKTIIITPSYNTTNPELAEETVILETLKNEFSELIVNHANTLGLENISVTNLVLKDGNIVCTFENEIDEKLLIDNELVYEAGDDEFEIDGIFLNRVIFKFSTDTTQYPFLNEHQTVDRLELMRWVYTLGGLAKDETIVISGNICFTTITHVGDYVSFCTDSTLHDVNVDGDNLQFVDYIKLLAEDFTFVADGYYAVFEGALYSVPFLANLTISIPDLKEGAVYVDSLVSCERREGFLERINEEFNTNFTYDEFLTCGDEIKMTHEDVEYIGEFDNNGYGFEELLTRIGTDKDFTCTLEYKDYKIRVNYVQGFSSDELGFEIYKNGEKMGISGTDYMSDYMSIADFATKIYKAIDALEVESKHLCIDMKINIEKPDEDDLNSLKDYVIQAEKLFHKDETEDDTLARERSELERALEKKTEEIISFREITLLKEFNEAIVDYPLLTFMAKRFDMKNISVVRDDNKHAAGEFVTCLVFTGGSEIAFPLEQGPSSDSSQFYADSIIEADDFTENLFSALDSHYAKEVNEKDDDDEAEAEAEAESHDAFKLIEPLYTDAEIKRTYNFLRETLYTFALKRCMR